MVQRCQASGGKILEGLYLWHQGSQEKCLEEAVIVVEALETLCQFWGSVGGRPVVFQMHLVLFLEHRPQFVMIQALSIFEVDSQDITEGLLAMRDSVPQITHGHQVTYLECLALLDEQLQHDFEG